MQNISANVQDVKKFFIKLFVGLVKQCLMCCAKNAKTITAGLNKMKPLKPKTITYDQYSKLSLKELKQIIKDYRIYWNPKTPGLYYLNPKNKIFNRGSK